MKRHTGRAQTHVMAEYPKWVDGELYHSEEELMEAGNTEEKANMVKELESMGKKIDLRQYKGANGFGALKAYYEAVMAQGGNDDDSGEDS